MSKENIKIKLREAIDELFNINEKQKHRHNNRLNHNGGKDGHEKNKNIKKHTENTSGKKEYADVKRGFEKLGGPSMVDIMKLIGIEDDEKGVNRSLFRKKVKQIKNVETGSYYQFDDEELAKVRSAMDIK